MKRDMDLVREILLYAEKSDSSDIPKDFSIKDYSKEQIVYHLKLLNDAGLITTRQSVPLLDSEPNSAWKVYQTIPSRLTWEGHEFLEAAKNDKIWGKAKNIVKEKGGGLTFEVIKALLIQMAKEAVGLP